MGNTFLKKKSDIFYGYFFGRGGGRQDISNLCLTVTKANNNEGEI